MTVLLLTWIGSPAPPNSSTRSPVGLSINGEKMQNYKVGDLLVTPLLYIFKLTLKDIFHVYIYTCCNMCTRSKSQSNNLKPSIFLYLGLAGCKYLGEEYQCRGQTLCIHLISSKRFDSSYRSTKI